MNFQGTRPNNWSMYAAIYDGPVYRFVACVVSTVVSTSSPRTVWLSLVLLSHSLLAEQMVRTGHNLEA